VLPCKNLFPRRPTIHRGDIEILTSNVIKMLAGDGDRSAARKKKEIDRSAYIATKVACAIIVRYYQT